MSAGLDIITVALLTPVLIAPVGDYAFPLVAVAATTEDLENNPLLLQGTPVFFDDEGLGLGIATLPAEAGRRDYVIAVEHGPIVQELTVSVIGVEPTPLAWWLLAFPGAALVASIRVRRIQD